MMKKLLARAVRYVRSTRAVSALEYALLVGVIATVIAAALVTFGTTIETALTTIGAEVTEGIGEVDD
ncbi:MAG: Flp family type IVb pilin [Thiotrichales bacterium]|nr:Flp family type IVb pilin [Thiotrichales bacterium]